MARKHPAMWAIGMMSGTSLDGVDAALIKTDGLEVFETGPYITVPFEEKLYNDLHEAVHSRGDIPRVERDLTKMHADVVSRLLKESGFRAKDIGIIGFHGQTIAHRPKEGITWQIGNGAQLAALTKIDVVCDFRRRDVAAGGEGAPLVPIYHAALAKGESLPIAVLNIGGIANVTWVGKSEQGGDSIMDYDIIAMDTGPGNVMLNEWMRLKTGQAFDQDGQHAARGTAQEPLVQTYMNDPYFTVTPPKSLDRNAFSLTPVENLSVENGAATLTAFMARSVAASLAYFPAPPKSWLITGGGRHNRTMMMMLSELLPNVRPVEVVGWNGDALEAQAFGFMAVRSLAALPISLPTTTGASHAVTGGAFYRAGFAGF